MAEKKDLKESATLNKIKILIVEDNLQIQEPLNDILSAEEYELTGVTSVTLAIKELIGEFYNLVLVDLILPNGSGLELLR